MPGESLHSFLNGFLESCKPSQVRTIGGEVAGRCKNPKVNLGSLKNRTAIQIDTQNLGMGVGESVDQSVRQNLKGGR